MSYRITLQHDERDCGAACLAMIASYYKLRIPISRCRELTNTDKSGTNLYGLTDGAKQIGLDAEALSGSIEELMDGLNSGDIAFPFIAHTVNENSMLHYIVIFGRRNGSFIVGDPGRGKQMISAEVFCQIWTGYIVTFKKTDAFRPGDYTRGSFLKFFQLLKGQWRKLTGVLATSLVIATVGILGAFVFQIVIDNFATEQGYYEEHNHEHENAE